MDEEIKILRKGLSTQAFEYPLKSHENKNYHRTLELKLSLYTEKIDNLPNNFPLINKIKEQLDNIKLLNKNLLDIINKYLWGSQKGTTESFQELIENSFLKNILLNLSENIEKENKTKQKLFRLRQSETDLIERNQMFHIPFSCRHLVANQRYSIAGLPCLYLGSSIYVSWLELNRPNLSNIFISGYKSTNSLSVLNLAYDLNLIIDEFEKSIISENQFIEKLVLWPLVMACSFQIKYPNAPFHEEYIIPGLLLEWITFESKNIQGLKYLSTKITSLNKYSYGINYVFPPQDKNDKYKFCPVLEKNFTLTKPLSWDLLTILPPADVVALGSGIKAENLEDALLDNYDASRFGFVEQQVYSMKFDYIKQSG
jgi:hypothetical protein